MNENSIFEQPATRALNISIRAACFIALLACAAAPLFVFGQAGGFDVKALWSQEPVARAQAEKDFIAGGPGAVRALVAYLRKVGSAHEGQIFFLRDRVPGGEAAVLGLLKDPELRNTAGELLFKLIGPKSHVRTPELLACLHDPEVNHYCGRALVAAMGPQAKDQVPALVSALKDSDPVVRAYAAAALGQIGPKAKDAVPALVETLRDPSEMARLGAAAALGKFGKTAKIAAPALEAAAASDGDYEVRQAAAGALRKVRK